MSQNDEYRLIQTYLNDLNNALKDTASEDIIDLFKKLFNQEQNFAKKLQSKSYGRNVYMLFIDKISKSQGGIKSARSYFRARQDTFLETVNKAIKEVDPCLMYKVPINYRFCLFAVESLRGKDKKLDSMFKEIKLLREEIINKHLYLSLNRAKIHSKNASGLSVGFEDLIQIANEALIVAVDKYVKDEEASSFHVMAIGRILSNLISQGTQVSSTSIGGHAQKKLYQIRKFLQNHQEFNMKEMSEALEIDEKEIANLLHATSYRSLDEYIGEDGEARFGDIVKDEKSENPYNFVENKSLVDVLQKSFDILSVVEKKVLSLKGVKIDG